MITPAPDSPTAETPPDVVNRDLPCARCGYNLRTQPWNGECPECGERVIRSGKPVGFRFASHRSEKLASIGVGALAAAFLIYAFVEIMMSVTFRLFYFIPPSLYTLVSYVWAYAGLPARVAGFAAALLITQPLGSERSRFMPKLAMITAVLALIGLFGEIIHLALIFPGVTIGTRPIGVWHVLGAAGLCFPLAYLLLCVHLLRRVERQQHRGLWMLLILAVVASLVLPSIAILDQVRFHFGSYPTFGPSGHPDPTPWWTLSQVMFWTGKNVLPACRIATLLALWHFLRCLRSAPRKPV